jgi:UDP-glucose 4-epimerase
MWKMNNERMGKIVVTGGCGYIGSHTIVDLIQHGFEVVCVDSLINSKALQRKKRI